MTRSWRHLLAACLPMLVAALLRGQDAADRSGAPTPNWEMTRYPELTERARPASSPIASRGEPVVSGSPLGQMVRVAGIIFSGRVTSIGRAAGFYGHQPVSTSVTFHVEQALRGASPGESLTIREWAGLWGAGERYRVGERVLLFLYSPSKLGLTSPVGGAMGRFAMDSRGMIVISPQHLGNLSTDPVLGGKTVVPYGDFALAVRRFKEQE